MQLAAFGLLVCPLASADVGLPDYHGPWPTLESEQAPTSPEQHMVIKQISHGAGPVPAGMPLRCDSARKHDGAALDFAAPADKRVDNWPTPHTSNTETANTGSKTDGVLKNHAEINVPVYINGRKAALRTGKVLSEINAVRHSGKIVLVSEDRDYFNRLQAIRPMDKLLVQTPKAVRHYQVTHTRITQAGMEASQAAGETLTLAACYPFQPIGGAALLYVVRAQPIPAGLPHSSASEEGGKYETIKF